MSTSFFIETSENNESLGIPSSAGESKKNKWRLAFSPMFGNHKCLKQESGFGIDQTTLTKLMEEKDLVRLQELGGVVAVAAALRVDPDKGIANKAQEISRRREAFGSNMYQNLHRESFFYSMWKAFQNPFVIILLVCAVIFFCIENMIQSGRTMGIVFVAFMITAITDYLNNGQLQNLDKNVKIEVKRGGCSQRISKFEIVVGDVICLEIEDQVPADGLLLEQSNSLLVDEISLDGIGACVQVNLTKNPFLFSGTQVVDADGSAKMLVVSVGMNTGWHRMMSQINHDFSTYSPLVDLTEKVKSCVDFVFSAIIILPFLIVSFVSALREEDNDEDKITLVDIVNTLVGFISSVFDIWNPFLWVLMLTRVHAMKKMKADNAVLMRKLSAFERVGFVTTVCTDETGILTSKDMEVTEFWVGKEAVAEEALSTVSLNVKRLIQEGGVRAISHSDPTEKAINTWIVQKFNTDMEELKRTCKLVNVEAFNFEKKRSGVLVKREEDNTFLQVHWKGDAELMLAKCSSYYDASGGVKNMDDDQKLEFEKIIQAMASNGLKCIAFAHTQVPDSESQERLKEDGLILLALMGISNSCSPEVKKAVEDCQKAGVSVKMITGDDIFTAKAVAKECGILKDDMLSSEAVIECVKFRSYSSKEQMGKVDGICVMAGASPEDKLLMVQCLQKKNHVVAVTGNRIDDAPALKKADIGIFMGIQGNELAKLSSDVIILDDNFASVVTIIHWGRCAYSNLRMAFQFQLTTNWVFFVNAIFSYTVALQVESNFLLLMNVIPDLMCAVCLAMEMPAEELMEKPPIPQTKPFITNSMLQNTFILGLYLSILLLFLLFFLYPIPFLGFLFLNLVSIRMLEKKNGLKDIYRNNKALFWIIAITLPVLLTLAIIWIIAIGLSLKESMWVVCVLLGPSTWAISWVVKFLPVPQKQLITSNDSIFEVIQRRIIVKMRNLFILTANVLFRMRNNHNQQPGEALTNYIHRPRLQGETAIRLSV